MAISGSLGFPNIGSNLELTRSIQGFINGEILQETLELIARKIQKKKWIVQKNAGIDCIPSNDFSYFDFVLDTAVLFGVIPKRFSWNQEELVDLETYFGMVGYSIKQTVVRNEEIAPLKSKPFFDTKYHYVVPEFTKKQNFSLSTQKPILEYLEAKSCGIETIPSILGPFSFLLLGEGNFDRLSLIYKLSKCYVDLLKKLKARGVEWVYFNEPCLTFKLTSEQQQIFYKAYKYLLTHSDLHIALISYFGSICQNWTALDGLPFSSIHLDLVAEPKQLDFILSKNLESYLYLSLGVVDAKNIWKNNLIHSLQYLEKAAHKLGKDRIQVAPTSSLLFVPYDKNSEDLTSPRMKTIHHKLAFAKQKIEEVALLTKGLNEGAKAIQTEKDLSLRFQSATKTITKGSSVKKLFSQKILDGKIKIRKSTTQVRAKKQLLDSLPQNPLTISSPLFNSLEKNQDSQTIDFLQSSSSLDLIALGEIDFHSRLNNFCKFLSGFVTTENGWVQSFGLECYKPPILYGDVETPNKLFSGKFVNIKKNYSENFKVLLVVPSTILTQSFLREDKNSTTLLEEVSLAVHKTILNLEKTDITFIQWEFSPLENLYWDDLPLENLYLKDGQSENRLPLKSNFVEQSIQSLACCCRKIKDETQIHIYSNSLLFLIQLDKLEIIDVCFLKISKNTTFKEIVKKVQYLKKNDIQSKISLDIDATVLENKKFNTTTFAKILKWINSFLNYKQIWVSLKKTSTNQEWKETEEIKLIQTLKNNIETL